MSTTAAKNQQSFMWMHAWGVEKADIQWLDAHQGATALHSAESVLRIKRMYLIALTGIATSDSPAASLSNALLV
jgi:hypothetical protein